MNGETATMQMLAVINADKQHVTTLCNQRSIALWLEAADVCNLTYACPYRPNTRLSCSKPGDIGMAWKQCSGPANCKRIAFIFDYFGSKIYPRALGTTHQAATTKHIMATMGITMDVQPGEMREGQKTCVDQMYSYAAKNAKNNILRTGWKQHHVRVNIEQGKARTKKNWKRPKEVFFNNHSNPNTAGETTVVMVSTARRMWCIVICWHAC
jgi:hypothetical protein